MLIVIIIITVMPCLLPNTQGNNNTTITTYKALSYRQALAEKVSPHHEPLDTFISRGRTMWNA